MKKNLIINFLKKKFSKTIQIPPKLRNESLRQQKGVFKYENQLENTRDDLLDKEKIHYNNLLESCSKRMIYNHFNLNKEEHDREFLEFYNYISNNLDISQLNKTIKIIDDIKCKLDSKDVEKTENVFKFLLSKLFYLTKDPSKKNSNLFQIINNKK
jgi:hypothetical protein